MKAPSRYHNLRSHYIDKLFNFKLYLESHNYNINTINQHLNYTSLFLDWLDKIGYQESYVTYSDLLEYINESHRLGDSIRLINRKLSSIRKYYEYLGSNIDDIKNPALSLYLKGNKIGIPHNLLEQEELEELYISYPVYDLRTARNRVILGLVIYQGLSSGELQRLRVDDITVKREGLELNIRGTKNSNGRVFYLEANQIIDICKYLEEIRVKILNSIQNPTHNPISGRKVKIENLDLNTLNNQLFISQNGAVNLKNSLLHLTKSLQRLNSKVRDLRQLRQSVITVWLKTDDVRVVQYRAGHKHVSTTERYKINNLDDLQEALNNHHPMK